MPDKARTLSSWLKLSMVVGLLLLLGTGISPALATSIPTPSIRPQLLPTGEFLRQYDPITVTFSKPVGRVGTTLKGSQYLSILPKHPGRYRWLNASTLEFRPTVAWPALSRFLVTSPHLSPGKKHKAVGKTTRVYRTLLLAPQKMTPTHGSRDQKQVRKLFLEFAQKVSIQHLASVLSFVVHPLGHPKKKRTLRSQQWLLKRAYKSSAYGFWVYFNRPLPQAHRIQVRLQLALKGRSLPSWVGEFTTRLPFHLLAVQCAQAKVRLAWGRAWYPQNQALNCGVYSGNRPTLRFSRPLGNNNPSQLRSLIRISPTVPGIRAHVRSNLVQFSGRFKRNTLYRLTLRAANSTLVDDSGQRLVHRGAQTVFFYYGSRKNYVTWRRGRGLVERKGPMMLPLYVRGFQKLDLRIYHIASDDHRFWDFPKRPVAIDETGKPKAPGQQPKGIHTYSSYYRLKTLLRLLGSPDFSKVINLPKFAKKRGGSFGLNLKPFVQPLLQKLNKGIGRGNSFLVGYRPLDGSKKRFYAKIQVTDLALSVVEQRSAVRFVVTSVQSAQPQAGALVILEATNKSGKYWNTLWRGRTDSKGFATLNFKRKWKQSPERIRIVTATDQLVLRTKHKPPVYLSNHWSSRYGRWLYWLANGLAHKKLKPLAHLWTDRPIYRPGEKIHLQALFRAVVKGRLTIPNRSTKRRLRISSGRSRWWYNLKKLSAQGSALHTFQPGKKAPTGYYYVYLEEQVDGNWTQLAYHSFKVEAYRVPKFEIRLFSKRKVPSDRKFKVSAQAVYYAGGVVVEKPIRWRVTERAISFRPPGRKGFHFSSSYRYSRRTWYRTRVLLQKTGKLNQRGQATLELDPTKNLYLRALRYTIEATVKGADGRAITAYRTIKVLPGFNLGLQLKNRFRLKPGSLSPRLVAVALDGKLVSGIRMNVELLRREWHFQLMETDMVRGGVKYNSEIVDKSVGRCSVLSSGKLPASCKLTASRSGIYILRVRARDKLNRLQTVSLDLYVEGKRRINWDRPKAGVFKLSLDKKRYVAGNKAKLLIRSPFQKARAMVVIEDPAGTRFQWVDVKGGKAIVTIPVPARFTPNVPVHVLLLQGRVRARAYNGVDVGRPQTLAASTQLRVKPRVNRVLLAFAMPKTARPGKTMDITLTMKTPDGRPAAGEVTLWAVDRAVLSLAREARLDPLKSFVKKRYASLRIRDTRRLLLGRIATKLDNPGGGGGDMSRMGRQTLRKNFRAVAFFHPQLVIGKSGKITIRVTLPDDLTTFDVRAIASSGAARFGFARRNLRVTLPVMVQRVLPRFLRPGDRALTGALARVTSGNGGNATVQISTNGLEIKGKSQRGFKLHKTKAVPVYFNLQAPARLQSKVSIKMRVTRSKDKETDAFQVSLPVKKDRRRLFFIREHKFARPTGTLALFKKWPEKIRPGSGKIEILLATRGELLRSLSSLEYLLDYPYGCAEQRTSRALALLALRNVLQQFSLRRLTSKRLANGIRETVEHLAGAQQRNGTFGFWSSSRRNYWLTAYITNFLLQARNAGFPVKKAVAKKALKALHYALYNTNNLPLLTKAEILLAFATAKLHKPNDARILFRMRQQLDLYGRSRLLLAMLQDTNRHTKRIATLTREIWDAASFREVNGKQQFQGLNFVRKSGWHGVSLSSKTRTLASVLEVLALSTPKDSRLVALKDALLDARLGGKLGYGWQSDAQGSSWGNTQNNYRAIAALRAFLKSRKGNTPKFAFQMKTPTGWSTKRWFGGDSRLAWSVSLATDVPVQIRLTPEQTSWMRWLKGKDKRPLWVRARLSYVPQQPGSSAKAVHKGLTLVRSVRVYNDAGKLQRSFEPKAGEIKSVAFGRILEESVRVLTTRKYTNVAIEIPIAAGVELLNPRLRTVSSLAKTAGRNTITPSHIEYLDDRIRYFFDVLPRGDHRLYFRARATTSGQFSAPPAHGELMYQPTFYGRSQGYTLQVLKAGK